MTRRPLFRAIAFILGMCIGWSIFALLIPGGAL